jgi:hypothetical protein
MVIAAFQAADVPIAAVCPEFFLGNAVIGPA